VLPHDRNKTQHAVLHDSVGAPQRIAGGLKLGESPFGEGLDQNQYVTLNISDILKNQDFGMHPTINKEEGA